MLQFFLNIMSGMVDFAVIWMIIQTIMEDTWQDSNTD